MRTFLSLGAVATVAGFAAWADDETRELGAHEHGHGTLNIAVEGTAVLMELEAPGADIVGFEHAAESDEDKAKVDEAKVTLSEPLALFVMPEAAGCAVADAEVAVVSEHHDEHEEEHEEGEHEEGEHEDGDHEHEGEAHNEFHAEYALECAAPAQIESIDFAYFDAFAGAEELDVNLVSDKGQAAFEVERDEPHLDLSGSI